jgi:uncharacterized membrane protein
LGQEGQSAVCTTCGKTLPAQQLISGHLIRSGIADAIRREHPEWSSECFICIPDLGKFRSQYVSSLLADEQGDLSTLEQEVLKSLREHEIFSYDFESKLDIKGRTLGERLADRIAAFGGSWTFLLCFFGFLMLWIAVNSVALFWHPVDPYPFILLNLILSCLAAVQAPIIMMSQNRQEAKDRLRSRHDYQVNLKAELEIRQLHEKIDHLLQHQFQRLVEIQQVQIDLLSELRGKK